MEAFTPTPAKESYAIGATSRDYILAVHDTYHSSGIPMEYTPEVRRFF